MTEKVSKSIKFLMLEYERLIKKQKDIIIKGFNAGAKVNDSEVKQAEKKLLKVIMRAAKICQISF